MTRLSRAWQGRLRTAFAGAAALALAAACPAATNPPAMTIGPPETLYGSITAFNIDMSCPTLRINDTEFHVWTENGDYSFRKYRGTLANPFQTLVWSGYSGRWDFTGFPTGYYRYRPWLANVYKCADGGLLGFVHVEKADWNDPNCKYSIGLAYSSDGGDHWKYCGDLLRNQGDALPGQLNMGGCPLLVVGDYFYVYFNDFPSAGGHAHAVARAPIAEVAAAAKDGAVTPWKKYNNGSWDQDGFTGVGSMILPAPDHYDLHSDAVYCAPLGKYLLTAWEQVGYTYPSGDPVLGANRGVYLYTSDDGVTWGDRRHLYTPAAGGETPYSFFAGSADATEDCQVVGSSFYLFFPDRINNTFFRIPFTIGDATGGGVPAAPVFAPAEGDYPCEQAITIRTATDGAAIRYTLDGSQPGPASGLLYTGPVHLAATALLKACAYTNGLSASGVSTGFYTLRNARVGLLNGSFETGTNGWTVAATNGGAPACAVVTNQGRSAGAAALAFGNANAAGNARLSQSLATLPGAAYTLRFDYAAYGNTGRPQVLRTEILDGGTVLTSLVLTVSASGNFDPAALTLVGRTLPFTAASGATTIRFTDQTTLANSAACDGMLDGIGVSGGGTVAAPVLAPVPGPCPPGTPLALAASPADAQIRYTLDNSPPTEACGIAYAGPFPLAAAATIRAQAFRTGMTDSPVTTGTYTLAAAPPAAGGFANGSFENGTNGWTVGSRDTNAAAYTVADDQGRTAGALALALGSDNRAGNAVFSQTLATLSGAVYSVRFDYGGYGLAGKPQVLLVTATNAVSELARLQLTAYGTGSYLPSSTTFRRRLLTFRAASETTVLRFSDLTALADSFNCDGMLDRIEIRGGGAIILITRLAADGGET
jgi:hypothetical protein